MCRRTCGAVGRKPKGRTPRAFLRAHDSSRSESGPREPRSQPCGARSRAGPSGAPVGTCEDVLSSGGGAAGGQASLRHVEVAGAAGAVHRPSLQHDGAGEEAER